MKKEYMISYSINDDDQRNRFELLMEIGFKAARKKHYKTVKFYDLKTKEDEKEVERKMRLIADEIMWKKDDELEILNLDLMPEISSLRYADGERVIIRGDGKLEEKVIQWMEMYFWAKQFESSKTIEDRQDL